MTQIANVPFPSTSVPVSWIITCLKKDVKVPFLMDILTFSKKRSTNCLLSFVNQKGHSFNPSPGSTLL